MLWNVSFSTASTFHALNFSFHYLALFSCHVSVLIRWLPCDKSSCCVSDTNAALKVVQLAIKATPFLRNFLKLQWDKADKRKLDMHSRLSPPAAPTMYCSAKSVCLCSRSAEVWSVIALAKEKWQLTLLSLNVPTSVSGMFAKFLTKKYYCFNAQRNVYNFCLAFPGVGAYPKHRMKNSAGAESVSANDDQVEIPVLKSNPKKTPSLVVAIRNLKPMSAAVRGSVQKSSHQWILKKHNRTYSLHAAWMSLISLC